MITICSRCSSLGLRERVRELLAERPNHFMSFDINLGNVEHLARTQPRDRQVRAAYAQMLFVAAVTALEIYLSDAFAEVIESDLRLLRRLVETDPEFKQRRYELREIFARIEGLNSEVADYLGTVNYHNIAKVNRMYETVLGVRFEADLPSVAKAISTRHDLVHRAGRTIDGEWLSVSTRDVREIAKTFRRLVLQIDIQIRQQVWEDRVELSQ